MQAENAVQLTDENFEAEVRQFPGIVLIDFWAVWCGPCQVMNPRIVELANKYAGDARVKIAQLNVDEAPETQNEFRIMSIPTFMIFAGGEQVDVQIGVRPTAELEKVIIERLKTLPAMPEKSGQEKIAASQMQG